MDRFLVIQPSGSLDWCHAESGKYGDVFRKVIVCSCLEYVRTVIPGICIVVDESGKIKTPMQRVNRRASVLYAGSAYGNFIHGPADVVALRDFGGELVWGALELGEFFRVMQFLGYWPNE